MNAGRHVELYTGENYNVAATIRNDLIPRSDRRVNVRASIVISNCDQFEALCYGSSDEVVSDDVRIALVVCRSRRVNVQINSAIGA